MSRYDREDDGYFRHDRYYGGGGGSAGHLQPPSSSSHQRPRSMTPASAELVRGGGPPLMSSASTRYTSRSRSRGRSRSRSRDRNRGGYHNHHHHHHNPIEHAEHALKHTFTSSNSGIGVGILGAVVGGLAARHITEASSSSSSSRHHNGDNYHHQRYHHHHGGQQEKKEHDARLLVSTLVGAAVGGLGANALERRIEHNREKKIEREEEWRGRDRRVARRSRPSLREGLNADYYRDHPASPDLDRDHVYDDRGSRKRLEFY